MEKKFNNRGKGHGKRGNNRSQDRTRGKRDQENLHTPSADGEVGKSCADNDWKWYATNPQLVSDVASLSFNRPLGLPLKIYTPTRIGEEAVEEPLPGILTIHFIPAVSVDKYGKESSAINVASRNLYSFVRHANSGSKNYEAEDLMTYVLALDSMYMMLAHMTRTYGIARTFSQQNRYYADTVLQALGFNPTDVYENLAQFRASINLFAYKLSQLYVPSTFTYFDRHHWLASKIFMDKNINKAQTYFYVPDGYWEWNGTYYQTGSACIYRPIDYKKALNPLDVMKMLNTSLETLLTNEDVGIMSGDCLKAFGMSKCLVAPSISEDYSILPEYSEEALIQFHNTVCSGPIHDAHACDLYQVENGALAFNPLMKTGGLDTLVSYGSSLIDIPTEHPTPEEVIVATRNMCVPGDAHATTTAQTVQSLGSEMFTEMWMYHDPHASPITFSTTYQNINDSMYVSPDILPITRFDYAPIVHVFSYSSTLGSNRHVGFLWETTNVTDVSLETIRAMHDIALINELSVPELTVK